MHNYKDYTNDKENNRDESKFDTNKTLMVDYFPENINYWLIRTESGEWYEEFISNNHVTIKNDDFDLSDFEDLFTLNNYKEKITNYNNLLIRKIERKFQNLEEDKLEDIVNKYTLSKRQISTTSRRLYTFIKEINIGDIILIPDKNTRNLKIGLITSNAKEYTKNQLKKIKLNNLKSEYISSSNKLYRKVEWLDRIPRKTLNTALLNAMHNHQTIIKLTKFKLQINQLLNPIFYQDNKMYINVNINNKKGLDNDLWLNLHEVIRNIENTSNDKFKEIKIDVQSPGFIELVLTIPPDVIKDLGQNVYNQIIKAAGVSAFILTISVFTGQKVTDIKGIKLVDREPYAVKKSRIKAEVEENKEREMTAKLNQEKIKKEIEENKKKQTEAKLDNEKKKKELEELYNKNNVKLSDKINANINDLKEK